MSGHASPNRVTVSQAKGASQDRQIRLSVQSARGPEWDDVPLTLGYSSHDGNLRIGDLPSGVSAFVLRLYDSWKLIRWEPGDGKEDAGAGRVFAAILHGLYNGHECRLCLLPSRAFTRAAELASPRSHMMNPDHLQNAEKALLRGLGLEFAFCLTPADAGDHDPQAEPVDYWWSPKASLSDALAAGWDTGCEGCVPLRAYQERLPDCLVADSRRMLACIIDHCRLVFQGSGEGEQMLIVSHEVSEEQVLQAADAPRVRGALRELTRVARFTEWEHAPNMPGPGQWWRKA